MHKLKELLGEIGEAEKMNYSDLTNKQLEVLKLFDIKENHIKGITSSAVSIMITVAHPRLVLSGLDLKKISQHPLFRAIMPGTGNKEFTLGVRNE